MTFCPWAGFKTGRFYFEEAGYKNNTFNLGTLFVTYVALLHP
jgi:hypothetical protein